MGTTSFRHKVVGIFSDRQKVDSVLNDLTSSGIRDGNISVLAKKLNDNEHIKTYSTTTYPNETDNALYYSNTEGYKNSDDRDRDISGSNRVLNNNSTLSGGDIYVQGKKQRNTDPVRQEQSESTDYHINRPETIDKQGMNTPYGTHVGSRFSVYDEYDDTYHDKHHVKEKDPKGLVKGAAIGGTVGVLGGLAALLIPGIGPILAAGPLTASLAAGGAIGATAGSIIGIFKDEGIPSNRADFYNHNFHKGNVIVIVHTDDQREVNIAKEIFMRYQPDTVDAF